MFGQSIASFWSRSTWCISRSEIMLHDHGSTTQLTSSGHHVSCDPMFIISNHLKSLRKLPRELPGKSPSIGYDSAMRSMSCANVKLACLWGSWMFNLIISDFERMLLVKDMHRWVIAGDRIPHSTCSSRERWQNFVQVFPSRNCLLHSKMPLAPLVNLVFVICGLMRFASFKIPVRIGWLMHLKWLVSILSLMSTLQLPIRLTVMEDSIAREVLSNPFKQRLIGKVLLLMITLAIWLTLGLAIWIPCPSWYELGSFKREYFPEHFTLTQTSCYGNAMSLLLRRPFLKEVPLLPTTFILVSWMADSSMTFQSSAKVSKVVSIKFGKLLSISIQDCHWRRRRTSWWPSLVLHPFWGLMLMLDILLDYGHPTLSWACFGTVLGMDEDLRPIKHHLGLGHHWLVVLALAIQPEKTLRLSDWKFWRHGLFLSPPKWALSVMDSSVYDQGYVESNWDGMTLLSMAPVRLCILMLEISRTTTILSFQISRKNHWPMFIVWRSLLQKLTLQKKRCLCCIAVDFYFNQLELDNFEGLECITCWALLHVNWLEMLMRRHILTATKMSLMGSIPFPSDDWWQISTLNIRSNHRDWACILSTPT